MITHIKWGDKEMSYLGRNGVGKCEGVSVFATAISDFPSVILEPINSKGQIARSSIEIPKENIGEVINVLSQCANMKLAIDSESVNIYIDNGDDEDPTHVIYWHLDEIHEDPSVAISIAKAIELYYTNPKLLLEKIKNMEVKIKLLDENAKIPVYAHDSDAGFDIYANETMSILPGDFEKVSTGIAFKIQDGYHIEIRSRSGLAAKKGVFVLNSPGTIDSDYTGELSIILGNMGKDRFLIKSGDRIAQGVLMPQFHAYFKKVEELESTERGEGGFGSTGI